MFPMAANILPMHKKSHIYEHWAPILQTKSDKNGKKTGLCEEKFCPVMIDIFLKNAHSDTICYCYGSAIFLGWNYTFDKHISVLKPPNNYPKMMETNLFVQTNLVRWGFWKKYVTRIFALKWHNFEYLGILCFSTMFYTSNSD